ncbi:MAG: YtxH domain-containing protein [Gemmatimonadetes bacterium]|nr:YtxH domain-containing protein [Gemmatimonadota bacterium]
MEYDHEAQVFNFISGLIVGAVLGAGIALLTAPDSGRKTRKRIRKTSHRIRGEAGDRFDDLADDVKGKVDDALQGARKRFS